MQRESINYRLQGLVIFTTSKEFEIKNVDK